jgi:hypothetical protein
VVDAKRKTQNAKKLQQPVFQTDDSIILGVISLVHLFSLSFLPYALYKLFITVFIDIVSGDRCDRKNST